MNLNCWCFLVHTNSSTGSSGKNTVHIDTWSNLKKEYIYIYKQVKKMYLPCCLQTQQFHWYSFILFIPLKFTPNHQIVKEVSFPKQRIDVKLRKDSCSPSIPYAPYTFHMANSCSTLSFKKNIQHTKFQVRTDRKDLCKFRKISFDNFLGGRNWLVEKGLLCVLGSKLPWFPYNGGWENQPNIGIYRAH